jgi:hypothetical protein
MSENAGYRANANRPSRLGAGTLGSVLIGTLALGCQPVEVREDANGAWSAIPPGSTLTLNRPVQVPQDRARIFFKRGRVLPDGANLGPSCGLEVRIMSQDGPQTVPAGTYRVERVERYWTQVAWQGPPGPVRLRLASSTDGGNPMIQEGYHLYLSDGPDPNVMRLTCLGMLNDMWRSKAITLEEIRTSLGSVATLKLAAPTASGP